MAQFVPNQIINKLYFSPFSKFCHFYAKLVHLLLRGKLSCLVLQLLAGIFWTTNSQPSKSQDPFNQTLVGGEKAQKSLLHCY